MKIFKGRTILFITVICLSFGNGAYSISDVSSLRVPLNSRRANEILRQAADRSPTNVQDASALSAVFYRFIAETKSRSLLKSSDPYESRIELTQDCVTIYCHDFNGSAITDKSTTVRKTSEGQIEITVAKAVNTTLYGIRKSSSTLRFLPNAIEYVSYDPEIWGRGRINIAEAIMMIYCSVPATSLKEIKFNEREFRFSFTLNSYGIPERIKRFFTFISEWGEEGDVKFEYLAEEGSAIHKPTGLSYFISTEHSSGNVENSAEITCSPQEARSFLKTMAGLLHAELEEGAIESFISGKSRNVLRMDSEDRYIFKLTQDGISLEYSFEGIKPNDQKAAAEQAFSIFQEAFATAINESKSLSAAMPHNHTPSTDISL